MFADINFVKDKLKPFEIDNYKQESLKNMKFYTNCMLGLLLVNQSLFKNANALYVDGMIRLYRGEDDYVDATGNGPTLTANGSNAGFATDTPYRSSPRRVMSFNIGGSSDTWATANESGLPTGTSSRTIMGWIKQDSTNTGASVPFGYEGGSQTQFAPYFNGGGTTYGVDYWGVTENINPIRTGLSLGVWYHIALAYDQSTGTLRAWLNGAQVKTSTNDPPNTASDLFVLSRNTPGTGDYYRGYLADVALFDKALPGSDVTSIYNAAEGLTADGAVGSACSSGSDCDSTFCVSNVCTDGALTSPCASGSDCSSTYCVSNVCTDGALTSPCLSGSDCSSNYCGSNVCTDGALGAACSSGSDCSSTYCGSNICTDGTLGEACSSASDCSTGYCSPTSSTCANVPILDPCHGISCSKHGKCKGNGICQCENTFIQTNDGKDCACPDGSFLDASANRCYALTASPTLSPTSLPVTSSPTSLITSVPTVSPTNSFDTPVCEDDSSYKFELKRVEKEVRCNWISKNKKRKDKRRARYCTEDFDNGALVTACKKSCNLCTV